MESIPPTVQEFQPSVETVHEEDCDTILLYLPGFKKEQLRVQLTRTRNLIISGGPKLDQQNKLSHFRKEFPVSTNVDTNKISAKFEGGVLFIRQPKLITPAGIVTKPPVEPAMPQKPEEEPQPEKKDQPLAAKSTKPLEQINERVKQETISKKEVPSKALGEETDRKLKSKDSKNAPELVAAKEEEGESSSGLGGDNSDITRGDGRMAGNTSEKQGSDYVDSGMKKYGGKRSLDKYIQSVGGVTTKLKKQRKMVNGLVVVLMAIALGIYVTSCFKLGKTEEITEM